MNEAESETQPSDNLLSHKSNKLNQPNKPVIPKIKHIVISGGSVWGLVAFGILYQAIEQQLFQIEDIESMFMTSVGSIIGTMLALKIDKQLLLNYLIKRPWETLCKNNRFSLLEIYEEKGIIHRGFFENMFSPLLKSVDLSTDITLAEFHKYNGIDLHIYTTELNHFESIDISFKTHPEWRLIDAIYASCCIPLLFSPLIIENKCYIDGAFHLNYPISKCKENPDEILAISMGNLREIPVDDNIYSKSTIIDLLSAVMRNIISHNSLMFNDNSHKLRYQIVMNNKATLDYCIQVLYNKEKRECLINDGRQLLTNHLISLHSQEEDEKDKDKEKDKEKDKLDTSDELN